MGIYDTVFSHLCIFENSDIEKLKREDRKKEGRKGGREGGREGEKKLLFQYLQIGS